MTDRNKQQQFMRDELNLYAQKDRHHKIKKIGLSPLTLNSGRNIYSCYDRPSKAKVRAYEKCVEYANLFDVLDYGILSFNTFSFTFGFEFLLDGNIYFARISNTKDGWATGYVHDFVIKMYLIGRDYLWDEDLIAENDLEDLIAKEYDEKWVKRRFWVLLKEVEENLKKEGIIVKFKRYYYQVQTIYNDECIFAFDYEVFFRFYGKRDLQQTIKEILYEKGYIQSWR